MWEPVIIKLLKCHCRTACCFRWYKNYFLMCKCEGCILRVNLKDLTLVDRLNRALQLCTTGGFVTCFSHLFFSKYVFKYVWKHSFVFMKLEVRCSSRFQNRVENKYCPGVSEVLQSLCIHRFASMEEGSHEWI